MNIRSIQKNFDEFLLFLSQQANFNVIALKETNRQKDASIFNINGYGLIYNEGNYNKYDGVVLYANNKLTYSYKIVKISETKAIEVEIKLKDETVYITALYKSPDICPKTFSTNLNSYLNN